ncbi:gas vesicle protein GvpO [Arthrobacter sp. H14]
MEVVESRRIPNSADVLAEYSVTIDSDGDLTAYSRDSPYVRGRTNRGE